MSESDNLKTSKTVESKDKGQVDTMWDKKRQQAIEKNKRALRSLYCVIFISILFITAEIVGGLYANSIAIMSDAAHLGSDALGIGLSVIALKIGERSADHRYSYGYHRAEIIGAVSSILFIWIVTVWLLFEATKRLIERAKPEGETMLWMSFVALTFNLIQMKILHGNAELHEHAHGPGGGCNHDHGDGGHHHDHNHDHHDHHHDHHDHHHDHHCQKHHDDHHSHAHDEEAKEDDAFKSAENLQVELSAKRRSLGSASKTVPSSFSKQEIANIENFKDHNHDHFHSHAHESSHQLTAAEKKALDQANKKKRSLNVEAAYLHILGDVLNSVGVIIASFVIWISGDKLWYFDPICTYFFSIIVLYTTRKTFTHCITMLMEATPLEIANESVTNALLRIEGVISVHCLHIWAISEGKNAISVHLVCDDHSEPLRAVDKMLRTNFGIHHIACQIERERDFQCGGNDLHQD